MASPRLCALSVAGLLVLGLSACDSTPEPVTTPPPSIDISDPSDGGGESDGGGASDGGGEATASDPEDIPAPDPADFAGMDEETPEGAEQAYRYYWAVLVWAHQTGDSERVAVLSTGDCENCVEFQSEIDELSDSDAHWEPTTIEDLGVSELDDTGKFDALIQYEFILSSESGGDTVGDSEAGQSYRTTGGMVWVDEEWLVQELSVEAVERQAS